MKRFADSVARQKGIKPPAGYTKSETICRAFLDQHARKKADGEPRGELGPKPASPAKMSLAEKIALERGIVIPDETKNNSTASKLPGPTKRSRMRSRKKASNPAIAMTIVR